MLEKTEWSIKDVQSRDTSNIVYKTENEVKQTRHAEQKAKREGNTDPTKQRCVNQCALGG